MRKFQKGFTLFVSLVLAGTLLLIASGVISLAVKQSLISSSGRESQLAFYAADSGMECALFWDVKNPEGEMSAFIPQSGSPSGNLISCNQDSNNPLNVWEVGVGETSEFTITFLPDPYCAKVTVTKNEDGTTLVESKGYNTCDLTNPRRVERAVRATYGEVLAGGGGEEEEEEGDGNTATYVGTDSSTQGNWIGAYGSDGYRIINNANSYISNPSYLSFSVSGNNPYEWANPTGNVAGLQIPPTGASRLAATWYSSSPWTMDMSFSDGNIHQVSFYMVDWDSANARSQTIEVRDADTGVVLDTRTFNNFTSGKYAAWTVSGNIQFRIIHLAGGNSVISGIFYD